MDLQGETAESLRELAGLRGHPGLVSSTHMAGYSCVEVQSQGIHHFLLASAGTRFRLYIFLVFIIFHESSFRYILADIKG